VPLPVDIHLRRSVPPLAHLPLHLQGGAPALAAALSGSCLSSPESRVLRSEQVFVVDLSSSPELTSFVPGGKV